MDNTKKKLLIVTAVSLMLNGFLAAVLLFGDNGTQESVSTKVRRDTVKVIRRDTIFNEVQKTIVNPDKVAETIIRYDTIATESPQTQFNVPITASTYQDSITLQDSTKVRYRADISGYNASLDSISFKVTYPKIFESVRTDITETVTKETVRHKKPKLALSLSVGAGYGIINRKPDIYAGFSLGIPIFSK